MNESQQVFEAIKRGDVRAVKWYFDAEYSRILMSGSYSQYFRNLRDTRTGLTPFFYAVRLGSEKTAIALSRAITRFDKDESGRTALHHAAELNLLKLARVLVSRGVWINDTDKRGMTPLHLAAARGHLAMVKYLVSQGASVTALDRSGMSPLVMAEQNGHEAVVCYLKDRFPMLNYPTVREAIKAGDYRALQGFLLVGNNFRGRDPEGMSPSHHAVRESRTEMLKMLEWYPYLSTTTDSYGRTPLHLAAGMGNMESAAILIKRAISYQGRTALDIRDSGGRTPLHYAAEAGHTAIVRMLLKEGAAHLEKDRNKKTPADLALREGHRSLQAIFRELSCYRLGFVVGEGSQAGPIVMNAFSHVSCRVLLDMLNDTLAAQFHGLCWSDRQDYRIFLPGARGAMVRPDAPAGSMVARVNPFADAVNPADYNEEIHIGRYFTFCRGSKAADGPFLRHLGFKGSPDIVARFGRNQGGSMGLELHLEAFKRQAPHFLPLAVAATDRLVYKAGEKISLFVLCMTATSAASGKAEVRLFSGSEEVPGSHRRVHLRHGLGLAGWEKLPQGHYKASVSWNNNKATCSFTVGEFSRSAAHAEWVDGPRVEHGHWIGTAGLYLYGAPLPRGTEINAEIPRSGLPSLPPLRLATDEESLVRIRIPLDEFGTRVMRISWQDGCEHSAELVLPGDEEVEGTPGVKVMAAPHEESRPAAGVHVSCPGEESQALRLMATGLHKAHLVAQRDLDMVALTAFFPEREPLVQKYHGVREGQELALEMPDRCGYGFLAAGSISGGRWSEQVFPLLKPSELKVSCQVPPFVRAGDTFKLAITSTAAYPVPVAVIVRDIRLHGGGGLEGAGASARIDNITEELRRLKGREAGKFSDSYLDGIFVLKDAFTLRKKIVKGLRVAALVLGIPLAIPLGVAAMPLIFGAIAISSFVSSLNRNTGGQYIPGSGGGGTIRVDLLPCERKKFGFNPLGILAEGGTALCDLMGRSGGTPSPHRDRDCSSLGGRVETIERHDTLVTALIETRNGKAEVVVPVPSAPATYSVELFAVDRACLGWASHRASFHARRETELYTDTIPSFMDPGDCGAVTATLGISSFAAEVALEVLRDGKPVQVTMADGSPVGATVKCGGAMVREVRLPLAPGKYRVSVGNNGGSLREEFVIRPSRTISERARRLVVLREGQNFEMEQGSHIFEVAFVADPEEVFRNCGQAVADYAWMCCEQTSAALTGAVLAYASGGGGGDRFNALGSINRGISRLESMWRGSGFAMYPLMPFPDFILGNHAYLHLSGVKPLRSVLGLRPPEHRDFYKAMERIDRLASKASRVYGLPSEQDIWSCRNAYHSFSERKEEAIEYVLGRWSVEEQGGLRYGVVKSSGSMVEVRSETCYAAAVLMACEEQRNERFVELVGTLDWIGSQMREGGRLYSSLDSAALIPLLACARAYGLFGKGHVSLDGGELLTCDRAQKIIAEGFPRKITCFDGQVQILVDMVSEREIPPWAFAFGFPARFERNGQSVREAFLGERLDLVIDAGAYEAGLMTHIVLPPCIAAEEGGARLQVFQRDFEGSSLLRIPCRAVQETGGVPLSGMAVLQNMYDEEKLKAQGLFLAVRR
ncbi:MAG: ankyrin repeat domain-containing protein [Candidatus Eremiobacteraeota bacterium]|nr:ankyrin repeat domain-containing protein [Candidatus Eremiobacteraeota bacterium]